MKILSKYLAMLAVLMAASTTVFADSRATPLERAREIADITAGGPHDPAPPIPAGDIVDHQRDLPPR
jgi:hypothetical protein